MGLLAFIFMIFFTSAILGVTFYLIDMAVNKDQSEAPKKTVSARDKRPSKRGELFFGALGVAAFGALLAKNWTKLGPVLGAFWEGLPGFILRWDVLTFLGLFMILFAANLERLKIVGVGPTLASFPPAEDTEYKNRTYHVNLFNYSATSLKDASSAYITAVSILIPASFVIIQVSKSPGSPIPPGVMTAMPLVFQGVVWFLISLFFGILTLYTVFTHGRYQELTRSLFVTVPLIVQLISLFVGVLSLAAGLYYVVFGDTPPAPPPTH